jgi:hypothetical protein
MNGPQQSGPPAGSGQEEATKRGVVIRLPRAATVFVLALLIVGALWLGSRLESGFSGISPSSFFGSLCSFFAVVVAVLFVAAVRKQRAVGSWAAAAATVVESEVVWGRGTKGGRTLVPLFTYEYAVGGRVYRGKRIAFFRHCTGACARELVARHPVGSQARVYYNPAKPAEVVMDRSFRALWSLPVIAVVLAALAVVFFKLPALLGR